MITPTTLQAPSQATSMDHVTVLSTVQEPRRRVLQKTHRWTKDGWNSKPYDKAGRFVCEAPRVYGIDGLFELLLELENDPHACIIRGELAKDKAASPVVRRNTTKNHGNNGFFDEKDRAWVLVDLDQGEFPGGVDYKDPEALEAAAEWARDEFLASRAPELRGVACVAQWSASAFLRDARALKLHLWFWLDRTVCAPSLNEWLSHIGADPALSRTVQPHYTSPPAFRDRQGHTLVDPLVWRTRLLRGERKVVSVPPRLLDSQGWHAKVEAEREAEEARQAQHRKEAKKIGPTDLSEDRAQAYLSNALDEIEYAPHGTRHNTVYGQSYWIGRLVAGENGLSQYAAKSALESKVKTIFANEPSLATELRAVEDGLKAGLKEPFYLKRSAATAPTSEPALQPLTASFPTLEALRRVLPDEIRLALSSCGTTAIVAPTGSGKTYAGIKALVELGTEKKGLWACFSIEEGERIASLLRAEGRAVFVAEGHNEKSCSALYNYLYASKLREGSGPRFCRDICPHRHRGCTPPTWPPDGTSLVVCTHKLAASIASAWEPELLIWDEGAKAEGPTINNEALGRAVARGEVTGDTTQKLLALMAESHGRKIAPEEAQKALAGLEVTLNDADREQAFDDLCRSGGRPKEEELVASWRALEALRLSAENEGKGAYIYKGELKLPGTSPVPDVPTRLVLDATATPLAALATYGPHQWRCLGLTPNSHATHIHIEANGGKSTRRADGTWEVQRAGRLDAALREALPDALQLKFKDWREHDEEEGAELTHYGAVDARGSNRWRDRPAVVGWDFYVNKETREARALLWAEGLKAQGIEPDWELLTKEAEWQLEIAPMVQGVGRNRPHEASAENPKLVVTIGKKERVPAQGGQYLCVSSEVVLWHLKGELTWRVASQLLTEIAKKRGGLWFKDLTSPEIEDWINELTDLQTDPGDPLSIKGLKDLFASLGNKRESLLPELREAWRHIAPPSTLQVSASLKGRHGVTLRFIPPTEGDLSAIEQRAQEEGWRGWTVTDRRGRELVSVDLVRAALERLPVEAHAWREAEIASWIAREGEVGLRTVRTRIAEGGGVAALRERLASLASSRARACEEKAACLSSVSEEEERSQNRKKWRLQKAPQATPPPPSPPQIAPVYAAYEAAYRDPSFHGATRAEAILERTVQAARDAGFEFTSFDREIYPLLRPLLMPESCG